MVKPFLVSIVVGVVAISLTTTPWAVFAQSEPTQTEQDVEVTELTQEQKIQLSQLVEQTRTQIQAILTPEQQTQFQAALQNGQELEAAFSALALSEAQTTQLRVVLQVAESQAEAILNPQPEP